MNQKIKARISGAIFDFMGYLTTRDYDFVYGSRHTPTDLLNHYTDWAAERGLEPDSEADVLDWSIGEELVSILVEDTLQGYWMHRSGKFFNVKDRHADMVKSSPKTFGLTPAEADSIATEAPEKPKGSLGKRAVDKLFKNWTRVSSLGGYVQLSGKTSDRTIQQGQDLINRENLHPRLVGLFDYMKGGSVKADYVVPFSDFATADRLRDLRAFKQ